MRSRFGRALFVGTVCLCITGGASHLLAKHYGAGTPWPKKKKAQTTQPTTEPVAPTTAPVVDDSIAKAETALMTAQTRARKKFESTPEWTTAQAVVSKAQADVGAATASVGYAAKNQPEYVAASAQVTSVEERLQRARDSNDSSEISNAASALMTARSALSALQNRSSAGNPALVASKEKLANANLAIEQLRKREIAFVQVDPDWQAAKKAYDQAREKVASASR